MVELAYERYTQIHPGAIIYGQRSSWAMLVIIHHSSVKEPI